MHELSQIIAVLEGIILGKPRQIRLALACLLARGHLLIEDLPGMGKTTLAEALARVLGLDYQRIQFTSDLLPADIIGVSIFHPAEQVFEFHPGPLFTQLVLADEINRTTPKTQSALLEVMAEGQVSSDGVTRRLATPFFVVATQNPVSQAGTYPLPESQLDRFLMRIELGYLDARAERELLRAGGRRQAASDLVAVATAAEVLRWQEQVDAVHVSEALLDYLQRLLHYTRTQADFPQGLSPRAGLALLQAARAWAYVDGRSYVQPEDLQAVLPAVAEHRLRAGLEHPGEAHSLSRRLLASVDVLG